MDKIHIFHFCTLDYRESLTLGISGIFPLRSVSTPSYSALATHFEPEVTAEVFKSVAENISKRATCVHSSISVTYQKVTMIAGVKREKDIDEHEEEGMLYLFIHSFIIDLQ